MNKISTKTTTFHSTINYGAILQTIALQKVLEKQDIENKVIDYTPSCFNFYNPFNYSGLDLKGIFRKTIKNILYFNRIIPKYFLYKKFIKSNIKLTKKVKKCSEIKKVVEKEDILITGSDQVWCTNVTHELSDFYTLNYFNNKKISYAASIGNSKIDEKYNNDYKEKIGKIDHISVREEIGRQELKKIGIDKKIDITIDPTLLLKASDWNKVIPGRKIKERYILAYTMQNNKEYFKIVNDLSKRTGLKIVYLDYRNLGFKNVLRNCYTSNPYEFVSLIKYAEYIVTTSFHGTVFSVIYNKKFWVIPHSETGNRVTSLLNKVGLNERIVNNYLDYSEKEYNEDINYDKVNYIIEELGKSSVEWLVKSIKD